MKKLLIIALAAVAVVSCTFTFSSRLIRGNGVEASKEFDLKPISAIVIAGSLDVVYSQGPQRITLVADENLLDIYSIEESAGVLHVSIKPGYSIMTKVDNVIRVSSEDLSSVKIAGSGDFDLKGKLHTDGDFVFAVNGSGDIEAQSIVCKNFAAKVNGSGDIECGNLTAEKVIANINGSGDILLRLADSGDVNAHINGSGDVTLAGNARSIDFKVNGSGDMHTAGLRLSGE